MLPLCGAVVVITVVAVVTICDTDTVNDVVNADNSVVFNIVITVLL